MKECQLVIPNKLGLHARAAARLVNTASQYAAEVFLQKEHNCINGKSIMGVMMLAASQGTTITLITEGKDEDAAMEALRQLIEDGFGEDR